MNLAKYIKEKLLLEDYVFPKEELQAIIHKEIETLITYLLAYSTKNRERQSPLEFYLNGPLTMRKEGERSCRLNYMQNQLIKGKIKWEK